MATDSHHDAVIVGGGHNGLVAAAYLARAGRSVLVLERRDHVGGAAVSERPWPGVDARLSRYSYLVSLLPRSIVDDLGLRFALGRRRISSYTPLPADPSRGLLVDAEDRERTGGVAARRHRRPAAIRGAGSSSTRRAPAAARALFPTMTEPLRPASRAARAGGRRRPRGRRCSSARSASSIEDCLDDDIVRGVVAHRRAHRHVRRRPRPVDLRQNRCFLYHVIGGGTGDWDVPMGGMGAVTDELAGGGARRGRARCVAGAEVTAVTGPRRFAVRSRTPAAASTSPSPATCWATSPPRCSTACSASRRPGRARGRPAQGQPAARTAAAAARQRRRPGRGVRRHLPRQRGLRPAASARTSRRPPGRCPSAPPCEIYCHSLTDPSILGPELPAAGAQTLTCFGPAPARPAVRRPTPTAPASALLRATLASLDSVLAEPLRGLPVARRRRAPVRGGEVPGRPGGASWACPAATSSTAT